MLTYATIAAVSYLLGSIPFGYLLVKLFLKQDIRRTGSGNIGATNVARSGAKMLAVLTLFLDTAKGFLAVAFGVLMSRDQWLATGDQSLWAAPAIAALFAISGHIFPVWLRFKGGKGVATAAGAFLALAPSAVLLAFAVFLIVVGLFRYVSLASIIAAAVFPVTVYFLTHYSESSLVMGVITACSLLIIFQHHANVRRLLAGTEHKLGAKPAVPPPDQLEKQA